MGEGRVQPSISPQFITGTYVSVWGFVSGVLVPSSTSRTPSRFCLEPRTLRSAQTPTDWATIVSYDTGVLQACLALASSLLEGCKEAANLSASIVYRRCNLLGLNCFAIIFSSSQKQTDDFHESRTTDACLHSQDHMTECNCSAQNSFSRSELPP